MTGYSDRLDMWERGTLVLAKPFTEETLLAKLDEARAADTTPRART